MALLTPIVFPDEPGAFDLKADPGFVAADDVAGDTFNNLGATGLYVENPTGGSIDLTLVGARRCNHGVLNDAAISIPAGFDGFVALDLETDRFSDLSSVVSMTYSAAGLNVGAVRRE